MNTLKQLNHKIIVGLSGGVDSSVAAYKLLQKNYTLEAVFMKNWEEDDENGFCSAEDDFYDAKQVCQILAIPLQGINFATEYWDKVFTHFLDEYRIGRTPNPDILCNKEIKFCAFLDYALNQGAEKIATGHYARIIEKNGCFHLFKSLDRTKDQSYFLHELNQHQLSHSLFPLGDSQKQQVRQIAQQQGFITHNKKDSTGICFIGERNFKEFLSRYLPAKSGEIVTETGECIAQHSGLMYYTLGQRQGLGIGGLKGFADQPWYVAQKDMQQNRLIVVQNHQHSLLLSDWLETSDIHWINPNPPQFPLQCSAKTRYRQQDAECEIIEVATNLYRVNFSLPQWAVTPGQSVVFYQGDECLGGGIINKIPHEIQE